MNKWKYYLKTRAALLLYYAASLLFLFLVPHLTGQPLRNTWYICLLLTVALLALLLLDILRWRRRRRLMEDIAAQAGNAGSRLPQPVNATEADCFAMIQSLNQEASRLRQQLDGLQREQLGYYTLWIHQIKTPISAMRLVLERMEGNERRTLEQELFKVEQYADLALRYVKLKDIASDLVIAPCALSAVVHTSVKKYALPLIYQKLSVNIAPMEKTIVTDSRWLAFVLEQILSNAAKYTQHGGISVTLDGNDLTVADTGIGIRAEDLPRIFEKGYTGYNGRLDARASGVGLYLAKKAADALSIKISVESTPGKGSAFTLHLPEDIQILE